MNGTIYRNRLPRGKVKVKCTLVQALRFCTGRTARRRTRLTTALEGCKWSASRPDRSLSRERPSTHCTGGWVGSRTGLERCGKSRPTGIRSPDRPARSQSLYLLHYSVHQGRSKISKYSSQDSRRPDQNSTRPFFIVWRIFLKRNLLATRRSLCFCCNTTWKKISFIL
jgi:hypothetical protein